MVILIYIILIASLIKLFNNRDNATFVTYHDKHTSKKINILLKIHR